MDELPRCFRDEGDPTRCKAGVLNRTSSSSHWNLFRRISPPASTLCGGRIELDHPNGTRAPWISLANQMCGVADCVTHQWDEGKVGRVSSSGAPPLATNLNFGGKMVQCGVGMPLLGEHVAEGQKIRKIALV